MCLSYTKKLWLVIFLITTLGKPLEFQALGDKTIHNNRIWAAIGRMARFLLHKCLPSDFKEHNQLQQNDNSGLILQECLKRKGLRAIDRALSRDIIEITEGVVLVKWKNDTEVNDSSNSFSTRKSQKEVTTKSLKQTSNWSREFLQKIVSFFNTRLLKFHLKGIQFNDTFEGRGRKKNNMMGQLMMFGLVAAGLIVIPMGFQFLAVLGGKALLLAKLALLLTSIQGLKKIATSHVNYGLYSTGHDGSWQYDRQWPYDLESYPVHHSVDSSLNYLQHSSAHLPDYGLHPRVENIQQSNY